MTKKCLILQHMETDGPGRFAGLLRHDGFEYDIVHVYRQDIPSLAGYDLMLVLGGAMDTWQTDEHPWLAGEKQAIAEWVGVRARPYIGICLGHQLLADALGGTVGDAASPEIGLHSVDLATEECHAFFAGLSGARKVLQWHHAEVQSLPEGGRILASSPTTAVQALAIGDHALGVQFHFEWTLEWIRNWPADWLVSLDREKGPGAYAEMIADAAPHMNEFAMMSETIYRNFRAVTRGRTRATASG